MIIPDVNILIYAYNEASPIHLVAREWWQDTPDENVEVGLPWVTILGFVRITTNPRSGGPLTVASAIGHVNSWLARPTVRILPPGERHGEILFNLLQKLGTAGNLTTDAHLAALALEYRGEVVSYDADFARFPGLRWHKPF